MTAAGVTVPVTDRIGAAGVVPVIVIDDAGLAGDLAGALMAGGLPCAEITLRTAEAETAIARMAAEPGMLVGAGTVLSADQAQRAVEAGARFVVTPGLDPSVVQRCRDLGVPVFPGVATATEIQRALALGLDVLKLFPAAQLGGLSMVRALAAPFRSVRFIPTGGIRAEDVGPYLREPAVLAVGGSWLVARPLLSARHFDQITRLADEAVTTAAEARGEGRAA
jgi:2-dehydro-3-deoxyphosphogluconate aldolase / (4S)-4-hydroxy-2-oxoglutarate aldolase